MVQTGSVRIDGIGAVSFEASEAFANPYIAVELTSTGAVAVATAEADVIGITQSDYPTQAGEHIAVKSNGYTMATAGDSIAIGDTLEVGANGKLVVADEGQVVAISLSEGEDGDHIEVLLK